MRKQLRSGFWVLCSNAVLTESKQQDSLLCPTSLKIMSLVLLVCVCCTPALTKCAQKTLPVPHHPSQKGRLRVPLLFPGSPHSTLLQDIGVKFTLLPDQIWICITGGPGEHSLCSPFGTMSGAHHQQIQQNLKEGVGGGGQCGFIWLWKQVRSVSCQLHAGTELVGPEPIL